MDEIGSFSLYFPFIRCHLSTVVPFYSKNRIASYYKAETQVRVLCCNVQALYCVLYRLHFLSTQMIESLQYQYRKHLHYIVMRSSFAAEMAQLFELISK